MDISAKLSESMNPAVMFDFKVFGHTIPVTDTVVTMWIVMAFLIVAAIVFTRNMKMVPDGKQNFIETVVELINNLVKDGIGHNWRPFAPYLGSVILFLLFSNIISVFNIIPELGIIKNYNLKPPAKDLNVTACLAIITILLVIFAGIRYKKLGGFLKHFLQPLPFMLPFNILDYVIKPVSLCFRLFGNILAAFIIMELLYAVVAPVVPAVLGIYFDLFDGLLQAYIFVFLTSLYIGEAIE